MHDDLVSAIMAEYGRRGGLAGRGDAKRRGTAAYYQALSKRAAAARAAKTLKKAVKT